MNNKAKRTAVIKIILLALAALGASFAIWFASFYSNNLSGADTAIRAAPVEIKEVINTTGMPLNLPDGFEISIYAEELTKPRVLKFDPNGILITSEIASGRVIALPDLDDDGVADEKIVIADNLNDPHGIEFKCAETCKLYIAESDQVAVYDYDPDNLSASNKTTLLELPSGGNHFTRTLQFLPPPNDETLLIAIGSTCNVCNEDDWRRAKILAVQADGTELREYSTGLRNSVFMTLHPETQQLWATEMGRDLLGDDIPPDEINRIDFGVDYGWPNCYGKNTHDDDFDGKNLVNCIDAEHEPSFVDLQAHSAPLGLSFVPADAGWPAEYDNSLLVGFHGSWNRTVPTGYSVQLINFTPEGEYLDQEPFIDGWLTPDELSIGRPVDVIFNNAGVLFISDDKAGVIYRVIYNA